MTDVAKSEPTVGELLGSLVNETGTLVRQEIRLASTEMSHKAKGAARDVALIGLGAALAHAGLLALIASAVIGLGTLIPMWVSALVIGVVAAGSGYAIVRKGESALRALDPIPQATVATLEQDKKWIKEQVR